MAYFDPLREPKPLNRFWRNLAWLTTSRTPPHMTTLVGVAQRGWSGQICDLSHLWVSFLFFFYIRRLDDINVQACECDSLYRTITKFFTFAVLERWLIYDCETDCSFVCLSNKDESTWRVYTSAKVNLVQMQSLSQGSHASWKVLDFFLISRTWQVLEIKV